MAKKLLLAFIVCGCAAIALIVYLGDQPEPILSEPVKPVVEPSVEVVAVVEPETVEEPAPPPPMPEPVQPVVELPAPDRYEFQVLLSPDGREMDAQVLDVVDQVAYIRRQDQRIFTISFERFHPTTVALLQRWEAAYAHQVTPEQKVFLTQELAGPIVAEVQPEMIETDPAPLRQDLDATGPQADGDLRKMEWELVEAMSDEFEGRKLNTDKWQAEPKGNGWNWIGRAPGLFLAENVRVEDGNMKVTVGTLDEPRTVNGHEFLYQGAIVRSIEAAELGMFVECKMKANATEMSSTFWLMTKGHTVKKLELDIQECVGVISPTAEPWAEEWDRIYHSNMIHRTNKHNPTKVQHQKAKKLKRPNHQRYYIYGAWWKSEHEVEFYLDGEHVYTIEAPIEWDVPAYIQMAIEVYDWNPVPEKGSMVEKGNAEERTTSYEWVRTWRIKPND